MAQVPSLQCLQYAYSGIAARCCTAASRTGENAYFLNQSARGPNRGRAFRDDLPVSIAGLEFL